MTTGESDRNERLEQVLAEYLQAVDAGQSPDQAALVRMHPDLADELRSFFANRAAVERLAEPLKGAAEEATVGMSGPVADEAAWRIRYFGDYELLQELGRGGMGVVYKARQTTLNRLVALKMILSGQIASAEDVTRFRQEAEAAARLDHPNIAPIYETGEHQGQHYFSMKLIEGRSLREAMPELKRDPRTGARLLALTSRAVHHAHQRGVLHRDLKPGNILLDQSGVPYVTDFGLAKRVEGDSDVTRTGAIVGTPSYMSPEQARAEKSLTPAVDVYSLGAILYEMLTGQPPFHGESPLKTLLLVASRDPVRPRAMNPAADRDLETIALKCLEKDPARRYRSAADLADDLERWLAGEPIQARPGGRVERLWKWARRRPTVAALAGVSLIATVSIVAAVLQQSVQSQLKLAVTEATSEREAAEQKRLDDRRRYEIELRQREQAERQKLERLYAANISLVGQAWNDGEIGRMRTLLDELVPAAGQPDLRGFEWRYLQAQASTERAVLRGHTDVLRSVAFSPDGKWLVSGSGSNDHRTPGELLRWDLPPSGGDGRPGREVEPRLLFRQSAATPVGAYLGIRALAISPDGRRIALGDNDRVRIIDSSSGDEQSVLPVQRDYIGALAYSPSGELLASGTLDGTVKFWDLEGREVAAPGSHVPGVTALQFSRDGRRLAVAAGDTRAPDFAQEKTGELVLWDVQTREPVWRLEKPGPLISGLALSPAGDLLATADKHFVQIRNAGTGQSIHSIPGQPDHTSSVRAVAFSPDGGQLASCGDSSIIRLWDVKGGRVTGTLKGHESSRVTSLAFSTDGLLASGSDDRTVRLWQPSETGEHSQIGPFNWAVQATAFSSNSQVLAIADYTSVTLCNPATRERHRTISVNHWCFGMGLSPDGRVVATGGNQGDSGEHPGIVKIWDAATGAERASLDPHVKSVRRVQFSPDGRRLLATGWGRGSDDSQATLWNVDDHTELGTWSDCPAAVFGPDSKTLALVLADGIAVWDIAAGGRRSLLPDAPLMKDKSTVRGTMLEFSPDGGLLAFVRSDGTAVVWDVSTPQRRAELTGHADVGRIAFAPGGRTLATMSPKEIRLWNCDSFDQRCSIPAGECPFVFTPDGETLITSYGGPALWHVATGQPLLKLRGYELPVNCLSISPDGSFLVEAGGYRDENEGVLVWNASLLRKGSEAGTESKR